MLGEESGRYKDYDLLELFDSYYIDEKRGRKSKRLGRETNEASLLSN